MRKYLTFLCLFFITVVNAQINTFNDGDDLSDIRQNILNPLITEHNVSEVDMFNILNYGAVGDDATDNTAAIQNAIDAAAVSGGVVVVPIGIYKTGALVSYDNILIEGVGKLSVLKANTSDTLISILYDDYGTLNARSPQRLISNIFLDGDSTGLIGLHTKRMYHFRIEGLKVEKFTDKGILNDGSLIGEYDGCYIAYCPIGIFGQSQPSPLSDADEIRIYNSQIQRCTTYGIKWTGGSQLKIESCHLHFNGVDGDSLSGSVYVADPLGSQTVGSPLALGFIHLLNMDNCWFESNSGVSITIGAAEECYQICVISNTKFMLGTYDDLHATIQMYDSDGSGLISKLILDNNNLQENRPIIADGDSTIVINMNSKIRQSVVMREGAIYRNPFTDWGELNIPDGSTPGDTGTPDGWAIITVDGIEKRVPYYD